MNRYLLILAVFAAVAVSAYAAAPLSTNSSPQSEPVAGWDDAAQAFRAFAVDASGYLQTMMTDARGRVSAPKQFGGSLATDTIKNLSAMASFTVPCIIRLQFNNTVYEAEATSTVATAKAGQRVGQYDTIMIAPDSASYDESFIAATVAASYTGLIYQQVP